MLIIPIRVVQVLERDGLDAMLQAKWNGMKDDLIAGDIQAALNYYSSATRDDYEAVFTALGSQLPQVVQEMPAIELVSVADGQAKYRIQHDEIHQGQNYTITYDIYFDCSSDGIWKIIRY